MLGAGTRREHGRRNGLESPTSDTFENSGSLVLREICARKLKVVYVWHKMDWERRGLRGFTYYLDMSI